MNSYTTLYGVFGDPIHHSRSPVMHNRAFQATGVNGAYAAFHVKPHQLKQAVEGIRALGFGGVNITIPHKVEVMQYLDEIDADAKVLGAVNTIVNRDGKLIGHNTDGIGYVRSLKEETGLDLRGKRILILGAGGAARGVAYALSKEMPAEIRIANRTKDKAVELADSLGHLASARGIGLDELNRLSDDFDLLINTTSIGMHPNSDELPVDEAWLKNRVGLGITVSDLIYNPMQTKLLQIAQSQGATVHGGLGMFVYQGAYAFEYWTGKSAPAVAMREAVEQSLRIRF